MLGKVSASMIFNFWTGMRMSRCILSCRYVAGLLLGKRPPAEGCGQGVCKRLASTTLIENQHNRTSNHCMTSEHNFDFVKNKFGKI